MEDQMYPSAIQQVQPARIIHDARTGVPELVNPTACDVYIPTSLPPYTSGCGPEKPTASDTHCVDAALAAREEQLLGTLPMDPKATAELNLRLMVDVDVEQLAIKVDEQSQVLRRAVLDNFLEAKGCLRAQYEVNLQNERAAAARRLAAKQEEVESLRRELSLAQQQMAKDDLYLKRCTQAISSSHARTRDIQAAVQAWYAWRDYVTTRRRLKARTARAAVYDKESRMRRALRMWRKWSEREHRVTAALRHERQLAAAREAADVRWARETAELKQQLQDAKQENTRLAAGRDRLEDDMKQAFMRGVCALNLEAMSVMKRGANSPPKRMGLQRSGALGAEELDAALQSATDQPANVQDSVLQVHVHAESGAPAPTSKAPAAPLATSAAPALLDTSNGRDNTRAAQASPPAPAALNAGPLPPRHPPPPAGPHSAPPRGPADASLPQNLRSVSFMPTQSDASAAHAASTAARVATTAPTAAHAASAAAGRLASSASTAPAAAPILAPLSRLSSCSSNNSGVNLPASPISPFALVANNPFGHAPRPTAPVSFASHPAVPSSLPSGATAVRSSRVLVTRGPAAELPVPRQPPPLPLVRAAVRQR